LLCPGLPRLSVTREHLTACHVCHSLVLVNGHAFQACMWLPRLLWRWCVCWTRVDKLL
jgi:hypothetical protein